jgi:flagellar assembly protein FliH
MSTITQVFNLAGQTPKSLFGDGGAIVASATFGVQEVETSAWQPCTSQAERRETEARLQAAQAEVNRLEQERRGEEARIAAETPPPPTVDERIEAALAEQELQLRSEHSEAQTQWEQERLEIEAGHAEILATARAESLQEGRDDAKSLMKAARGQLADAMGQLSNMTRALLRRYKTESSELAIELARAVVGDALQTNALALEAVVERAMSAVPRTDEVVLRCHPDDVAAIEEMVPSLQARRSDPVSIRLAGNPAMEPGGCIIEFGDGAIDARPSVAMDMLAEAVRAAMASVNTDRVLSTETRNGVRSVTEVAVPEPEAVTAEPEAVTADSEANLAEPAENEAIEIGEPPAPQEEEEV